MDIEATVVRDGLVHVDTFRYDAEEATVTMTFVHSDQAPDTIHGTVVWTGVKDFNSESLDEEEEKLFESGRYLDSFLGILQNPAGGGYAVQVNTGVREVTFFAAHPPQWIPGTAKNLSKE